MVNLSKEIKFGNEVREKMQHGADELANAVKSTLGPKGRYVVIERGQGYPKSTKDGVSVAKEIFFEDHYKNVGAQMIKQVATKSADEAGDGTTTATVLAQALLDEGNKAVSSGINPVFIKRGMEDACQEVISKLKEMSKQVNSTEDLKNIATISANNDMEIGGLIADAMEQIGDFGSITVSESNTGKTELEVVPGMTFDQGLISPYLINNYDKMCCEFQEVQLLLVDGKVNDFNTLVPYIEHCSNALHKPLVVIAEDFTNDALTNIIYWATPDVKAKRMGLDLAAVKAPGFGNRRLQILEDLAALTGGTVITADKGLILGETDMEVFGQAERIVIKQYETAIYGGYGTEEQVNNRIKYIQSQMDNTISDYDKIQYTERLSKMNSGMAIIKAGGNSELEIKEKKDRLDDAIKAAKAAKEEGIVIGGGTALYLISKGLKLENEYLKNQAYVVGYNLIKKACQAPIRTILENSGLDNIEEVLVKITKDLGYNARTEEFVNLEESGIIDPTKVVRCALQNAVSVAGVMLTTAATIVSADSKTEPTCTCAHQ